MGCEDTAKGHRGDKYSNMRQNKIQKLERESGVTGDTLS